MGLKLCKKFESCSEEVDFAVFFVDEILHCFGTFEGVA